jgi:hypothetical protein
MIWSVQARLNDGKFIPTEPGDEVAVAGTVAHAFGCRLQQLVPYRMTERIVDALEIVEVEAQHREGRPLRKPRKKLFHFFVKQNSVRQVRERVVVSHIRNFRFAPPLVGNILEGDHEAASGYRRELRREGLAVGSLDHDMPGFPPLHEPANVADDLLLVFLRHVGPRVYEPHTVFDRRPRRRGFPLFPRNAE